MSIVEVGLLSGFKANQNELRELVDNNDIELQRYETEGRKIVLYLDQVKRGSPAYFSITQQRTHCVANIQPAFVQAYSYYEPDYHTTVPYQPPSTLSGSLDLCASDMHTQEEETGSGTAEPGTEVATTGNGDPGDQESLMDAM